MNVLVMETGSFKTFGGAANASYGIYKFLKKFLNYNVYYFADFSKIDKSIVSVSEMELGYDSYDIVLMNSIRDVPFVTRYMNPKKNKRAKFIYTDRGNVLLNFRKSGVKKLLPKMLARQYLLNSMRSWLDCYVAISAEQYEAAKGFFSKSTKIYYLPIAPAEIYDRVDTEKGNSAVYVGRLDERQKKVSFLIRGIARARELHNGLKGKELLRIAGTGPDKEAYMKLASSLGVADNIRFMGFVEDEELVALYNSASFFVSASEWEGMSRTFVEAMACGLPLLINTNNNTLVSLKPREYLVTDGYNGMVYEYGNIDDFAAKFTRMYNDRRFTKELSEKAYKYSRNFSLEKNLRGYKKIMEALYPY